MHPSESTHHDAAPLKVLFVSDHLKRGGAERHMVDLAIRLAAQGLDVRVAYLKRDEDLRAELEPHVRLICCDVGQGVQARGVLALRTAIRDFHPSVVVAVHMFSLVYAVLATRWLPKRPAIVYICHSMGVEQRGIANRLRFLRARLAIKRCDLMVFVCANQTAYFARVVDKLRVSSTVIHNGIDVERFSHGATLLSTVQATANALRIQFGVPTEAMLIGVCAGLREEKRHEDLLDALVSLRNMGLDVYALLVGDGVRRPQIERGIAARQLTQRVFITGFQADVRPFISVCDVMVLPSATEAFPLSTLEAMAMGKAMVATAVGGVPEQIVNDQTGKLYPAGDIDALVRALVSLIEPDAREQLGKAAADSVHKLFDIDTMVERFEHALRSVAQGLK